MSLVNVDKLEKMLQEERITFSSEDIDSQLNDKAMGQVLDLLSQIKEKFEQEEDYTREILFKKDVKWIQALEDILSERFGMQFEIISSFPKEFMSVIVGPKRNTGLFEFKNIYKTYEESMAQLENVDTDGVKDYKLLENIEQNKKAFEDVMKAFDSVDDTLYNKGITVDFKNAKLYGLDKDVKLIMSLDFEFAFKKLEFSIGEMLSVILHEIGHAFSYFAQSYKTYTTYVTLQDSLRELGKKGTDMKKSLLLSYTKATGNTNHAKDLEKQDLVGATVGVVNAILGMYGRDGTVGTLTTVESLADLFASRFGYGIEISKALKKLGDHYKYNIKEFSINVAIYVICGVCAYITGGILGVLSLTFSAVFPYVILSLFFGVLNAYLVRKIAIQRYEDPYRRLQYIRNQIVYLLRNHDKSNKEIVEKLNKDLKELDITMSMTAKHQGLLNNIALAISKVFSKGFRDNREKINLHYELEKLLYNDIHVANSNLNEYLLNQKG